MTLVENDIYADLDPQPRPSLASLDQLKRVIYIGSFSKTISPNMRVGYLLAGPRLMDELAQLKMVSGLTSSDLTERVAYGALTEGRWRKHLKALRDRLAEAHQRAAARLLALGFELFNEPKAGHVPVGAPPRHRRQRRAVPAGAAEHDIMLGPGHLFPIDLAPSPAGFASTSPIAPTARFFPFSRASAARRDEPGEPAR